MSPRQPVLDKYNPTLYGDHTRDFQPIWYTKFPWLDYDIKSSKVSCFACHQFSNDNHFIFDNWKKIDRLKKHSVSQSHLFAMKRWADFQAAKKNKISVLTQLRSQHAIEVAENRSYLKIIIESISFLGK